MMSKKVDGRIVTSKFNNCTRGEHGSKAKVVPHSAHTIVTQNDSIARVTPYFRFWIVGCIRFENGLLRFTEINMFTWKNPKHHKENLEKCSMIKPDVTGKPTYKPGGNGYPKPVWPTRPPFDPHGDGWQHYWDNSFKKKTPRPINFSKPRPMPQPGRWDPWKGKDLWKSSQARPISGMGNLRGIGNLLRSRIGRNRPG